jgi:hypothetical protein
MDSLPGSWKLHRHFAARLKPIRAGQDDDVAGLHA